MVLLCRRTSPEVTLRGHNVSIARLVFSADGKRLASSVDSPDGERLASAGRGNVFRLWDAATGRKIQTLKGQIQATSGVAFSPDGKRLAGAGPDLSVKIWDTATSEAILVLKGHNAAVTRVAFMARRIPTRVLWWRGGEGVGRAAATRRAREAGPDLALAVSPSRRAVVAKAARGDDHCVADDLCPAGGPHPSGGRRSWRSSLRDHSPEDGRRAGSPVRVGIPCRRSNGAIGPGLSPRRARRAALRPKLLPPLLGILGLAPILIEPDDPRRRLGHPRPVRRRDGCLEDRDRLGRPAGGQVDLGEIAAAGECLGMVGAELGHAPTARLSISGVVSAIIGPTV